MANFLRSHGEEPVSPAFWFWFAVLALGIALRVRKCLYVPPEQLLPQHAALGCGYCMVAANTGPVWVKARAGECDELV